MSVPHLPSAGDRRTFLRWAAMAGGTAWACGHRPSPGFARTSTPAALRVRVWCEGTAPRAVYPQDVDGALGDHLGRQAEIEVRRSRLNDPAAGLDDAALDATDVLIWWGHLRHDEVPNDRAEAVAGRVRAGRLGLVALHSAWASKPFRSLMGTTCEPSAWREDGQPEHVRISAPDHPIARGVAPFTIPRSDMFAAPFHVPPPQAVILVSAWERGESFHSGLAWSGGPVGAGRVAYLRTGHDAFPVLFQPSIRQLVANAARWVGRRA